MTMVIDSPPAPGSYLLTCEGVDPASNGGVCSAGPTMVSVAVETYAERVNVTP